MKTGDTQRVEACYYSTTSETFNLNLSDGNPHQVALYLQDEANKGRTETVTVTDATSGQVLDTTNVSNFAGGEYLVYTLGGDVEITLANGSGSLNAVASGLFFAPPGSVTGTVFNDANMNGTLDTGETAFAGVTVTGTDAYTGKMYTATTDSSGHFTIADFPAFDPIDISAPINGYGLFVSDGNGGYNTGSYAEISSSGGPVTLDMPEYRSLPAPSGLTATSSGSGQVALSWTSNSAGLESGLHVYDSVDGGAFSAQPIATAVSGATTATITGLDPSHDYRFRVAAYDANGDSYFSNVADAAAPPAPTEVDTTALLDGNSNASVTVNWVPAQGVPAGTTYDLYRSQGDVMPSTPYATGLTGTSYVDTSVAAGQHYYYWVAAVASQPLQSGYTPQSGGTGGPDTGVPGQVKTVTYYQFVNPMASCAGPNSGSYGDSWSKTPTFDTSLGTETGGGVAISYIDAGLFIDPNQPGGTGSGNFWWGPGDPTVNPPVVDPTRGLDSFVLGSDPGTYFHATHIGSDSMGLPPKGWVDVHVDIGISGGGDPCSLQAQLAGFLATTYTYT